MCAILRQLIARHTRITTNHLTPEIKLHLITPECELWCSKPDQIPFVLDPFWAFYWPGGQAISRYILDNSEVVKNKRVLDVGSGCGACAIAAVKSGASLTVANDISEEALVAAEMNAKLNNTLLITNAENLIGTNCANFDTILIGDMFYDEEFANSLFDWLEKMAAHGKDVLIGDPGRHCLTEKRIKTLKQVAQFKLEENTCLENRGFVSASVWKIK